MQQPVRLTKGQINYCMECGVCTASCPVSRELPTFSPRQFIKRAMMDPEGVLSEGRDLWACLTCARCSTRCPVEIKFPEFNRSFREKARREGNLPLESHNGVLQTIAELQTRGIPQKRTAWAEGVGAFKQEKGEVMYFVGCLPYFDVLFQYLQISPLAMARSALRLLNRLNIEPVLSNKECCCGHDAFWSGNMDTFKALAVKNVEVIRKSGAKTVLFTCPEGYTTFKDQYPEYVGQLPFEVMHMTEFLVRELPKTNISFDSTRAEAVAFQDPCRLGRFAGLYDPPRDLLKLVPGTCLVEMDRNKENAMCCGTSAWMECSKCSKAIRVERLQEALCAGAQTLITACPKCNIHFTCSRSADQVNIKVTDLYTYLTDRMV